MQSRVYIWQDWINEKGTEVFQNTLARVTHDSSETTEWYKMMVKTHKKSLVSDSLSSSLQYQRTEYAAILLMNNYTNLAYLGHISSARAFLYHKYYKENPPIFTRVSCKASSKSTGIRKSDASHTIRMILSNIEETLSSENFPNSEKELLIENALNLFYAYQPKTS